MNLMEYKELSFDMKRIEKQKDTKEISEKQNIKMKNKYT